jgi:hypothetical protein
MKITKVASYFNFVMLDVGWVAAGKIFYAI